MNEKTALITGGAGFIGSNLVRYIERHSPGWTIRILDDLSTGSLDNLEGTHTEFLHGSILDRDLLTQAMTGVDSVVHLAAIPSVPKSVADPRLTHETNVTGTLNVLESARRGQKPHVIVASSSAVYGDNPAVPMRETEWTSPLSPYGVSKLATEGYAIAYQHSYAMQTLAFRFFNVFGPGQSPEHDYAAVIPAFLDAALAGNPVPLHGDGTQSRDFVFVDTVCAAIHDAMQRQLVHSKPVNLAFGTHTTLRELLNHVKAVITEPLTVEQQPARVGDIHTSQADGTTFAELFPAIEPINLRDGVAATAAWLRSRTAKEVAS